MSRLCYSKHTISKLLFFAGLILLSFVFFIILISSVLFIFNFSVSAIVPFVSLALAFALAFYLSKKQKLLSREMRKPWGILSAAVLLVVAGSIFVSGCMADRSYDGDAYHKVAIGKISDGWNPVYETVEEFDQESDFSFNLKENGVGLWINHYAKASYIYAANIYLITDNIETGKSINFISLTAMLLLYISYLIYRKKSVRLILLFAIALATCPVFMAQISTNYVDLLLGIYLFMLILCFFFFEEEAIFDSDTPVLILYFIILCIIINIKFTAFAYAGIYSLGYYIWYIYRLKKNSLEKKFFLRFTGSASAGVIVGTLIIGLSTYPKNFLTHGNPFYPLFGEGKVDIMTGNSPANFPEMSPIKRFILANFCKSANMQNSDEATPQFKLPFTFDPIDEGIPLSCVDLRIGGHGPFFGGILIICGVVLVFALWKLIKRRDKRLMLIFIPTLITLVFPFVFGEVWWARYFPQLFLITLFAVLFLDDYYNNRISIVAKNVLIITLLLNNFLTLAYTSGAMVVYNMTANKQYEVYDDTVQNAGGTAHVYAMEFKGALYNARDRLPDNSAYVIHTGEFPLESEKIKPLCDGRVMWSFDDE